MLLLEMRNAIEVKNGGGGSGKNGRARKGKGKRVENSGNTVRAGKGGGTARGKRLKWKTSVLAGSRGAQPAAAAFWPGVGVGVGVVKLVVVKL